MPIISVYFSDSPEKEICILTARLIGRLLKNGKKKTRTYVEHIKSALTLLSMLQTVYKRNIRSVFSIARKKKKKPD